ncbi:MAG: hypothetical protein MUE73_02090 [Planctomycetes bacterium]|jgi:hypothetical protein|nr:hypothetical protein [Planctomycetota bacterium]
MPPSYGRRNGNRGYNGRNSPSRSGPDQRVLLAIIGGGGLVVIILLVILLSRGGDRTPPPAGVQPLNPPVAGSPPPVRPAPRPNTPPAPLTQAEKDRVHSAISRLAAREAEVRRLVKEGFEAQNDGDNDGAQESWKQAYSILKPMIEESETLFDQIGDERVELYASQDYRVAGGWASILAEFLKYLESR